MSLLLARIAANHRAKAQAYYNAVMAATPYIYYRLGEAGGTTVADSSGNGLGGSIAGTAGTDFVLGASGLAGDTNKAIQLKTNSGYVRSTAAQNFPVTNVTLSCFIKTDVGAAAGFIAGLYALTDPSNTSGSRDRLIYIDTSGRLVAYIWSGSIQTIVGPVVNDGVRRLIHFAIGTASCELYVNGTSVGTNAHVSTDTGLRYLYGGMNNTSGQPGGSASGLRGVLDELCWYNTRLSAATILAQAQTAGF